MPVRRFRAEVDLTPPLDGSSTAPPLLEDGEFRNGTRDRCLSKDSATKVPRSTNGESGGLRAIRRARVFLAGVACPLVGLTHRRELQSGLSQGLCAFSVVVMPCSHAQRRCGSLTPDRAGMILLFCHA